MLDTLENRIPIPPFCPWIRTEKAVKKILQNIPGMWHPGMQNVMAPIPNLAGIVFISSERNYYTFYDLWDCSAQPQKIY
jgi:hypothetical protein